MTRSQVARLGGIARMANVTSEERSKWRQRIPKARRVASAKKAIAARWAKYRARLKAAAKAASRPAA